jgi:hypothetical protein
MKDKEVGETPREKHGFIPMGFAKGLFPCFGAQFSFLCEGFSFISNKKTCEAEQETIQAF